MLIEESELINKYELTKAQLEDARRALIDIALSLDELPYSFEAQKLLPYVTVYPVMHDQAYGGPEEGGWWYHTYDPIKREKRNADGFVQMRLDKAIRYVARINEKVDAGINKHRRPISSVNSDGEVRYLWSWDAPVPEPRCRPHYE